MRTNATGPPGRIGPTARVCQTPEVRVLQLTSTNDRRGAETFAGQLADELRRRSFDVTTAALGPSSSSEPLPFVVLGPGRTHPRTWMALVGAARAHDVIVAHGGPSLQPAAAVAALTRRPFIYRNIGDPAFWGGVRGADLRIGGPLRRAAAVMALYGDASEYLTERYRLDRNRVVVSTNAVDVDRFRRRTSSDRVAARVELGVEGDDPVVGYLGALSAEKCPGLAVDVVERVPGARLLLAGDGPLRPELETRAASSAWAVRLVGSVADPARFLDALDAVIIPSRTEGVPGTLLEAALVGVPVVATDVGGVREVVDRVGGGVVVPSGDVGALVDATESVLARPEAFVADQSEVVARHGMVAIADDWARVLRRVVR
jgi:glycosyltransferase involved in cell wall biosynthesis